MSHKTASAILLKGDGRSLPQHFDPDVLATFDKSNRLIADIYREYSQTP